MNFMSLLASCGYLKVVGGKVSMVVVVGVVEWLPSFPSGLTIVP